VGAEEEREFYLLIENDLNTYGYNNWFFFRLKNVDKGVRRFTMVNMIKKTSFFGQGMLISIFSLAK
jgi:cytosolic carboxypeptidase protein 2/3